MQDEIEWNPARKCLCAPPTFDMERTSLGQQVAALHAGSPLTIVSRGDVVYADGRGEPRKRLPLISEIDTVFLTFEARICE
jgi:hypothetical protein